MKIRLQYHKKTPLHMISHLDLIQVIERTFRRANLPMIFSEGFNPHPKLSFSFALSLGIESENEWVDVEVADDYSVDFILERLNIVCVAGLRFVSFECLDEGTISLSKLFQNVRYQIQLPFWNEPLEKQFQCFDGLAEKWIQKKSKKNKTYEINCKERVKKMSIFSRQPAVLGVELSNNSAEFLNPKDFLLYVFEDQIQPHQCTIIKIS